MLVTITSSGPATTPCERGRLVGAALSVALCAVAVLTAVLVARLSGSLLAGVVGVGVAALTLLPLALSARLRTRVALCVAIALTAGAALGGTDLGLLLVPVVLLSWVAALVPWRVSLGFALAESLPWRLVCGLLVGLPAILLVTGALTGTIELEVIGWAIVGIALVIAVSLAAGVRIAALVAAALGLVTMILTVVIPGLLVIGTWWAGGLLLVVGAAALSAWGSKAPTLTRGD
ncbi:hypothetical protein GCM10020360_06840 [Nonlabens tegetincola]